MSTPVNVPRQIDGRPLFIQGYFSSRMLAGELPTYGYPKNHVPDTTIPEIEVVTGFMAAIKERK